MKLNEDFIFYEIDGEKILVCLDSRKFSGVIKLNTTAVFIAEKLKEETTKEELALAVVEHYSGVDMDRATKAVDSVIESLVAAGAISQ